MATLRRLAMHAPRPRRPCRNFRRGALVVACSRSDAAAERGGVHADAGRLQRAGPRLTARGRFDAGRQRVDPGAPARESSPVVEGDSRRICHDAYELGDRGAGPTADAGAFGMGHALTVADRPTRTNNSGSAQPSPRKRVCDVTCRRNRSGKRRQRSHSTRTLPPLDPASIPMPGPGASRPSLLL